jgi:putative spermidine/putrescine transport system ATP-binding protein/spermidine/putrescine transport system ATP-binding protein
MSDRVVVMQAGRIEQDGRPAELYERPRSLYVAQFLGTSNLLQGLVAAAGNGLAVIDCGGQRLSAALPEGGLGIGSTVTLCIRPEKAQLLKNGRADPGESDLKGRLSEMLFHGSTARLMVDLGQGEPFAIDVQLQDALSTAELPRIGETVTLSVHPRNVAVFREGEGR